jgi:hypothetical protein
MFVVCMSGRGLCNGLITRTFHSFILLHSIVSHTGDNPLDTAFVNYNRDI